MFDRYRILAKSRKELYKPGMRVVLNYMNDNNAPPSGTKGNVVFVDDIGTIHVNWDNGSTLGVTDEDSCSIIRDAEGA